MGIAAGVLAALLVLLDVVTGVEVNESILFSLPIVLAGLSGSRRLIWGITAALLACTYIIYYFEPGGVQAYSRPHLIDRTMVAVTILVAAGLMTVLMRAIETLEARGEAAEAASRRKTRLLASVSHDVRTPLTTINLIADLIRRSAGHPELARQLHSLAEDLGKNALSISELLSDALDISALESGRVSLHESEFSLNELLGEESRRFAPLAEAKGIGLAVRRAPGEMRLRTDPIKLGRILDNLLSNAVKFTDHGRVEIGAELARDGSLLVRVADTGIGIAPQDRGRVFEEFAQVGSGRRQGWGLGLNIARRFAELMGGTLQVESAPGSGSVFTLRLPAARVCK